MKKIIYLAAILLSSCAVCPEDPFQDSCNLRDIPSLKGEWECCGNTMSFLRNKNNEITHIILSPSDTSIHRLEQIRCAHKRNDGWDIFLENGTIFGITNNGSSLVASFKDVRYFENGKYKFIKNN